MKSIVRSLRRLPRLQSQYPHRQHQYGATLQVVSSRKVFTVGGSDDSNNDKDEDPHALFKAQLEELKQERQGMFGITEEDDTDESNSKDSHALLFKAQMEQLKEERQDMFGFTQEDHDAWSNAGDQLPSSLMRSVEEARAAARKDPVFLSNDDLRFSEHPPQPIISEYSNIVHRENYEPSHGLTHLSEDGSSVNMVDVGHKIATKRMARAETKMILPPEVLQAFQGRNNPQELVGPKGPIFATAKIAGIMAAKKTSDLIPLCHPLPLDKVQVDIRLENNVVFISCECRVTHKTGVEMEALTGASVTALTIYDMLKALSHNIRIEETKLVSKSGGKRTVG